MIITSAVVKDKHTPLETGHLIGPLLSSNRFKAKLVITMTMPCVEDHPHWHNWKRIASHWSSFRVLSSDSFIHSAALVTTTCAIEKYIVVLDAEGHQIID